jgi:hypothetical protein
VANCFETVAILAAQDDEPEDALRLFAAAANIRDSGGAQLSPGDRLVLTNLLRDIRGGIDAGVADLAWQEGTRVPIAALVTNALDLLQSKVPSEQERTVV